MLASSIKYPTVFVDAKELLVGVLEKTKRLGFKKYGDLLVSVGDLVSYNISDVENELSYANIDLYIKYKLHVLREEGGADFVDKERNLRVLCNLGDSDWTYRMIDKVWEGDYPSTVAVDMDTGEVFLLYLRANRLELVLFGVFSEKEFESFKFELQEREPFSIKIDEKAMFTYIDGAEGINHLKNKIFIEFNCHVPLRIYNIHD